MPGVSVFSPARTSAATGMAVFSPRIPIRWPRRFSLLKNHGSATRNHHQVLGWNSRLDELQAAVLRVKLRHLDTFNRKRIDAATRYTRLLDALPVQTPQLPGDLSHVFHQYTLLSPKTGRHQRATAAGTDRACGLLSATAGKPAGLFRDFKIPGTAPHGRHMPAVSLAAHVPGNLRGPNRDRRRRDPAGPWRLKARSPAS